MTDSVRDAVSVGMFGGPKADADAPIVAYASVGEEVAECVVESLSVGTKDDFSPDEIACEDCDHG